MRRVSQLDLRQGTSSAHKAEPEKRIYNANSRAVNGESRQREFAPSTGRSDVRKKNVTFETTIIVSVRCHVLARDYSGNPTRKTQPKCTDLFHRATSKERSNILFERPVPPIVFTYTLHTLFLFRPFTVQVSGYSIFNANSAVRVSDSGAIVAIFKYRFYSIYCCYQLLLYYTTTLLLLLRDACISRAASIASRRDAHSLTGRSRDARRRRGFSARIRAEISAKGAYIQRAGILRYPGAKRTDGRINERDRRVFG